jgi:subtilase family serine protease
MAAAYSGVAFRRVLAGALFFIPLAVYPAQRDRISGPADDSQRVVLRRNTNPRAKAEYDRGAVEPALFISHAKIAIAPTAEQTAALGQLLEEQRDPGSANYHNWLTPEEYGERFGLSDGDLGVLSSWLQSQGLAIEQVARARNWIAFSGAASRMASAFQTEIHRYEVDGETHFANASEPSVPAAFAGVVAEVRGLDDFRPKPPRATVKSMVKPVGKASPDFTTSSGVHYLAPDDIATIYDIAPLYTAGFNGTGQKLAIAGQTDINLSDIRAFRAQFNLAANDPQLVLYGPDPGLSKNDEVEADLDLEWSGAVARNAKIVYVYSQNVFESLQYAIDENLAPVISVSYGGCESGAPTSFRTVAQQAGAQGITWVNASGDQGAAGCDYDATVATHGPSVTFPADIPEVTAVGGTEFNETSNSVWSAKNGVNGGSALSYIPEKGWNDTSLGDGIWASGGGASALFAKPWWQTGPGVPADRARDVPDVALSASGDHDGYLVYAGGLMVVGGTSATSPSFAGIVSLINQYVVAKGSQSKPGLGNINPNLYSLAQSATGVFHDITTGDNIVPCTEGTPGCTTGTFGYKAGPGYDLVTGLGSVDAYNLTVKWASQPASTGTTMTLGASPSSLAASATTQLTAAVTPVTGSNPPAGSVAFAAGTVSLGSVALVASGATAKAVLSVKGSSLLVGSNTVTASYSPAGNFSPSTASVSLTVTSPPPVNTGMIVTASPVTMAQSGATVLSATVKPASGSSAPSGTVTFTAGKATLGTVALTASGTSATAALTVKGSSLATGSNTITATYSGATGFNGSTGSVAVSVTAASASNVVATVPPNSISQTSNGWGVTVELQETAGVATTITGFTINGTSFTSAIAQFFGTTKLAALGTLTSSMFIQWKPLPTTIVFGFTGVDASGHQWSQSVSVSTVGATTTKLFQ